MASVSKRLATDETLMLLVDAVNNTETVKQAKAEIQAEGTAQVNNVKSTAEEMVKDINQVPKNTSDIAELNSNLDVIGKCKNLLNPTLQNATSSGVTCTNNGDGTYTLNGTATYDSGFIIQDIIYKAGVTYKLVGCPIGGSDSTYRLSSDWGGGSEYGSGKIINYSTDKTTKIGIYFSKGMTFNNLVFKPMLTTNLNATYDDFVPYTGDGETLTSDVASLKNDLSGNDKVVIPLLNSCTGDLYYHKIGDLIVVNGVVNIPKANANVSVAVLPNSKVSQGNAFTIYNFTDDTHDSEYAVRYASDSNLVVKVPIANKDYVISGCYIGN